VDAVVVSGPVHVLEGIGPLMARYPGVPWFVVGPFRPGDGGLLARHRARGVQGILVDGVDDPVCAELIARRGASRVRWQALQGAPRMLRLTEPLQRSAWAHVLMHVDQRLATADIARALRVTREHLSREFGAGGAPNLKRVIDLVRVVCAADLLRNPGYDVGTVARVLRFSSPSHLGACSQRIAGVSPTDLATLEPMDVLGRFVRGRTRSRV
jgi:AraC-like DNA-binding protein